MTSFQEALQLVLANLKDFNIEEVPLLQSAGRILAQDVFADRDFPPYNRVMMDGVAISMAAYNAGTRSFQIEKVQAAGSPQQVLEEKGHCIEVMTGSVLPANTDVVIPYEQCDISERIATIPSLEVTTMQNVHIHGADGKKGELLVKKHERITAATVGVMASVGLGNVKVVRLPKITICSTGDELVEVSAQPAAHQVRRSNVYMLAASLLSEGIHAQTIHLPDDPEQMTDQIQELLTANDVVLFSGAVSKGKYDYLPQVLKQLGMQQILHSVAQRPGKPFLFGKFPNSTLVFGFPGNPVSTFVCYQQFFKAWLRQSMHQPAIKQFARLAADVHFKPALTYHLLVRLSNEEGSTAATPAAGSTSGDLVSLIHADGILTLPAERDLFKAGEVYPLNVL